MQQNYQTTLITGLGQDIGPGSPNAVWSNPNNISADDGNMATIAFSMGGQDGDSLRASSFGFNLPPGAVIDGLAVNIDGQSFGGVAVDLALNVPGTTPKSNVGALATVYGGPSDLWGVDEITLSDLSSIYTDLTLADQSGGDGSAEINYISITVYWHIDLQAAPADVPEQYIYKVYNRNGEYLGNIPNVTSRFGFQQDIGSAGSSIEITSGKSISDDVTAELLATEDGDVITTEDDIDLLATLGETYVAAGNSSENVLFKNSNRVKVFMYDYWHPNGKLMFSGQMNRVSFKVGGADSVVKLNVISDGLDLDNFIARGYPFSYTNDVSQTSQNGYVVISQGSGKQSATHDRYGQTWRVGGSVTNVGAITLRLRGTATVTLRIFDAPNGNLLGSVTKPISIAASGANVDFEFPQLIPVNSNQDYFMELACNPGQNFGVFRHSSSATYANGSMYRSQYAGTGGGAYVSVSGDFYFVTKYGAPTTTTTYSTQDPVTGMAAGVLADYNTRGGYIRARDLVATGLSLTYTFNMASILDVIKKVVELSPYGYYSYVDLGTAEIDIMPANELPDFTVVNGEDSASLELSLSIEGVKNDFLFTGGEVSPGVNLYKQYQDTESAALYGLRTATKTDNRVLLDNTANALGVTFINENSDEVQETSLVVINKNMDITKFTPGKTIGFKGYGGFIDNMVLQIVRRDFKGSYATLTLGRLPISTSEEVQRINRELIMEQTVNNPTQPT